MTFEDEERMPGHSPPAAGFEVPLEMLAACHDRIRHKLSTLERLPDYIAGHGIDRQAVAACEALLRYFDTAAKLHHQDEEEDLFPAMLESVAGSDPVCIRELFARLVADHQRIETMWIDLSTALRHVIAGESLVLDRAEVRTFSLAQLDHIEQEEAELLPMAARLLSDELLDRVGLGMRHRRGVRLDTDVL